MRQLRFIGQKTVTPGTPVSFDAVAGRYIGLLMRLTGTTDTGQTLAPSEVGTVRVQRGGNTIQSRTFEFFHEANDINAGFPEATLPTAGTTEISAFIPFFAPRLSNSMEVVNDDELKLFFTPDSGLSTEFGSNPITFSVYGVIDTQIPEVYELHVRSQDISETSSGLKTHTLSTNNCAALYLESTVVSTIQIDTDDRTVVNTIDLDVMNVWGNMEFRIEASGNNLVPFVLGSGRSLGSYLNESVQIYPNFTGSGDLKVTILSLQPSPRGRVAMSQARAQAVAAQAKQLADSKLINFSRRG